MFDSSGEHLGRAVETCRFGPSDAAPVSGALAPVRLRRSGAVRPVAASSAVGGDGRRGPLRRCRARYNGTPQRGDPCRGAALCSGIGEGVMRLTRLTVAPPADASGRAPARGSCVRTLARCAVRRGIAWRSGVLAAPVTRARHAAASRSGGRGCGLRRGRRCAPGAAAGGRFTLLGLLWVPARGNAHRSRAAGPATAPETPAQQPRRGSFGLNLSTHFGPNLSPKTAHFRSRTPECLHG